MLDKVLVLEFDLVQILAPPPTRYVNMGELLDCLSLSFQICKIGLTADPIRIFVKIA